MAHSGSISVFAFRSACLASCMVGVLFCGCQDVDRVTHEGASSGFAIGTPKRQVFDAAKAMYARDAILWLAPKISRTESMREYGLDVFQENSPMQLATAFADFQWWFIRGLTNGLASVSISFEFGGTNLDMIVANPVNRSSFEIQHWPNHASRTLRKGMTYEQAYDVLCALVRDPGYTGLLLQAKDQRKVKAFTALDAEFMNRWDTWIAVFPGHKTAPDFVELSFVADRLESIRRVRRHEILPF